MNLLLKSVLCVTLLATVLYLALMGLLYRSLNDPSASAPVYAGQVIDDAHQRKIESTFDQASTAADVARGIDLRGKRVVITGGHSGTGLEAVKALSLAGAEVTALARDVERARENLKGLPNVEVEYVDLLKPKSIEDFSRKFLATQRPIHALINSAGIIGTPLQRDARGYERQFATNVLGHYELTLKLIPALERAKGARIVNLASRGHRAGGMQFEDIHFERSAYSGMRAYAQTKTALVLLSIKQDELLKSRNIRAFAVHPGAVPSTDLFVAGTVGYGSAFKVWSGRTFAALVRTLHITEALNLVRRPANLGDVYKTVQQGGATTVWAATSAALNGKGGLYLEDSNVAVIVPDGSAAPFGVRPWALDKSQADRLWKVCERLTGIRLERGKP